MTKYATTYGDVIGFCGDAEDEADAIRKHYETIGFLSEPNIDHSMKVARLTNEQATAVDAWCEKMFRNTDDNLNAVIDTIRWTAYDDQAVREVMSQ